MNIKGLRNLKYEFSIKDRIISFISYFSHPNNPIFSKEKENYIISLL